MQYTLLAIQVGGADSKERRFLCHDGGHLRQPVGITLVKDLRILFRRVVAAVVQLRLHRLLDGVKVLSKESTDNVLGHLVHEGQSAGCV